MGVCVSKRPQIDLPQQSGEEVDVESNASKPESSQDSGSLPKRKSLYYQIDPVIPDTFYPKTVLYSPQEELCQATFRKLAPKEKDKSCRCRAESLTEKWRQSSILGEIESHALSVSALQCTSVQQLAQSLTSPEAKYVKSMSSSDPFPLEMAKAYAIYFWVANNIQCSQSMWKSFLTNPDKVKSKTKSEVVLQSRESVSLGHAKLFCSIAAAVGLNTQIIVGNLKVCKPQSAQGPLETYEPNRGNEHYWNAVKLGGVWFPLDCACGAGMLAPHLEFNPSYTLEYFAPRPEVLIFTHWPADPQWQLLAAPISLDELQPMIAPRVTCFSLGIQPHTWTEVVEIASDSDSTTVMIQLAAPSTLQLSAHLSPTNTDSDSESNALTQPRTQQQSTYLHRKDGGIVDVYTAVPSQGEYTLEIHAQSNQRSQVCLSYQIHCATKPTKQTGFPTVFGRASAAFSFKLLYWNTPQMAQICENEQGKLDIVFRAEPNLQFYHCLIPGNATGLQVNLELDAQYFCTSITHDPNDPSLHKLSAVFPNRGWWTVYLCATRTRSDTETSGYTTLLSHPFFVKKGLRKCSYPHSHSNDVRFEQSEPITCRGTEILVIPFYSTKKLNLYSFISYNDIDAERETVYTQTQIVDGLTPMNEFCYTLKVIFPKPGKWYVQVLACESTQPSDVGYLSLFNIFTEVDECLRNVVFPIAINKVIEKYDIQFPKNDPIRYSDDGEPFCFTFQAPNKVNFIHRLQPMTEASHTDPIEAHFDEHCTFLNISDNDSNCSTYTLKVVFPREGKWNILICAGEKMLSEPLLAIQIAVDISRPLSSHVFPKIHPAFYDFDIQIADENLLYQKDTGKPEFIFEVLSPENIHFGWALENIQTQEQEKFSTKVFMHCMDRENSKQKQSLHLIFPKPGCWLLRVSAKSVLSGIVQDAALSISLNYQPVFDILIQASNASLRHMAFPILYEAFHSKFGLSIDLTHLPLRAQVRELPTTCTIKFHSPPNIQFWHEGRESSQYMDQHITRMMSNPDTGLYNLLIEITQPGRWVVNLHAKDASDSSTSWTTVLRHTILAKSHGRRSSTLSY